jgi:hypothetical protein
MLKYKREHWDKSKEVRRKYLDRNREEVNFKQRERAREK